jgi:hypothetical protein
LGRRERWIALLLAESFIIGSTLSCTPTLSKSRNFVSKNPNIGSNGSVEWWIISIVWWVSIGIHKGDKFTGSGSCPGADDTPDRKANGQKSKFLQKGGGLCVRKCVHVYVGHLWNYRQDYGNVLHYVCAVII